MAPVYDRLREGVGSAQLSQLLTPAADAAAVHVRTTAGDEGAARVRRALLAAFESVQEVGAAVTVTSEPLIIQEMSEDLSAFQTRSIVVTLGVVTLLLTGYYALARRRWSLGPVAMLPAVVSASATLGSMRLLGFDVNVLTATMTAVAIGIGVPYGVHVVNRFVEDRAVGLDPLAAVTRTLRATGAALAGSALTTLAAFVVLSASGLPPIRSLGLLGGVSIAVALLAALLVVPGALVRFAPGSEGVAVGGGTDAAVPPDGRSAPVAIDAGRRPMVAGDDHGR